MKKTIFFGLIGLLLIIACHLIINIFIFDKKAGLSFISLPVFAAAYILYLKYVINKIREKFCIHKLYSIADKLPEIPNEKGIQFSLNSRVSNKMSRITKIELEKEKISIELNGDYVVSRENSGYYLPIHKSKMEGFVILVAESLVRFDKRFAGKDWIIRISITENL